MIKKEIWKNIKEFEGIYQISNLGRIKSIERQVSNGKGQRIITDKILKYRIWNNKYYQVKLSKKGKVTTHYVHRLVAETFITNEDKNKNVINHIDNNGLNNIVENLEWCTQKENVRHAWNNGYCENEFGERDFEYADIFITDKRLCPYNPCTFSFNNETGKLISIETV